MKFTEDGYQLEIWTEVGQYKITNHVEVTPTIKNIEATVTVGDGD